MNGNLMKDWSENILDSCKLYTVVKEVFTQRISPLEPTFSKFAIPIAFVIQENKLFLLFQFKQITIKINSRSYQSMAQKKIHSQRTKFHPRIHESRFYGVLSYINETACGDI